MSSFIRLYTRVLSYLGPEKFLAIILALCDLALAVAQFAEPVLFGKVVDLLAKGQAAGAVVKGSEIVPWMLAWAGFGLFTIIAGVLVSLNSDRLAHRRRTAAMADFFEHVLHLPLSFHSAAHSGRLLKVMIEGANSMFSLWLSFFRDHCAGLIALFVLMPLTLFVNWRLASILLALVVVFALAINLVSKKTRSLQNSADVYGADLAERVSDVLGNVAAVQSFTAIELESLALRSLIDRMLTAQLPVLTWWAVASITTRAAATLALLAIFSTGVWLNLNGLASLGEIVTFMALATSLIVRLEQVVGFFNFMVGQAPKFRQFFDVMDVEPAVADRPGAVDVGRVRGDVAFEHVSYRYDKRRAALDDVSFEARQGQTIAIVGPTGSGKSTALSLLHRVFDPQSGRITIDGRDLADIKLTSLRQNIGVVFQEPFMFARTIEENLRLGKPDATHDEIQRALELAQAADFVSSQPDGLSTIVGERGRNLSGGERQRLSIARALLKDPPIMLLDEATSALDAKTERLLQDALENAMRGRTTFVIAHRLATIRSADCILVLDKGRIVETGTFEELVALDGLFARLARAQFMVRKEKSVLGPVSDGVGDGDRKPDEVWESAQ